MRLGNILEVTTRDRGTLAQLAAAPASKPNTDERGTDGVVPQWGGDQLFDDTVDPNALWLPPDRWGTVADMLTHPDVAAALDAVILPVLSAQPTIEPGVDDPRAEEVADFIAADFQAMTKGWFDIRFEAIHGALSDGVAPFQKVYAYDKADGLYHLAKLAYRDPRTVSKWRVDEHGGPAGFVQSTYAYGQSEDVEFDIDELLIFTHRRKGANMIGDSLLRSAYEPFLVTRNLSRIGAAAVERHGLGIPVMRPRSRDSAYLSRIERLLAGLRGAARSFVRLEPDQEMSDFQIMGLAGSTLDPVPQMEYHRRGIYLRMLCPFLPLGTDGVGSMALSETQLSFFMELLGFVMRMEEETWNKYLLRQWVGYNWPDLPLVAYPRVVIPRPESKDVQTWAGAVASLVASGVQLNQAALVERAQELLNLEVPEAAPDAGSAAARANPEAEGATATDDPAAQVGAAAYEGRALTRVWPGVELAAAPRRLESEIKLEALGIRPNFVRMESTLNEGRDSIARRLGKLQDKQANRLRAKARAILKRGDPEELAAFLDDPASIPYAEEREAIEEELRRIYASGVGEVGSELGQQGVKPSAPDAERTDRDKGLLALLALFGAKVLADRMMTAFGSAVTDQLRSRAAGGSLDVAALDAALTGAPAKLLQDIAARGANAALGMGRGATVEANAKEVGRLIYTTMLDINVCQGCSPFEGQEFTADTAPAIPNPACEGASRCRCQLIPVAAEGAGGKPIQTGDEIAGEIPW